MPAVDLQTARVRFTDGFGARPANDRPCRHYSDTAWRLYQLRRVLGRSQHEMAAALGMTVRTYRAYERNQRTGRGWLRFIYRVVDAAQAGDDVQRVSLNWLMCGSFYPWHPSDDRPLDWRGRPLRPPLRAVN